MSAGEALETVESDPAWAPRALAEGLRVLSDEPVFQAIIDTAGAPRFRRRRNGFGTLLHIILEQQVSIDAAAAMYRRLAGLCETLTPESFLAHDDATLRACGFSRQKAEYARLLAMAVQSGVLDFARLEAADDETAFADLRRMKGIGRWSAEMFLMFHLMRPDLLPLDDLGLRRAMEKQFNRGKPMDRKKMRKIGERWAPYRSVASWYLWRSLEPLATP